MQRSNSISSKGESRSSSIRPTFRLPQLFQRQQFWNAAAAPRASCFPVSGTKRTVTPGASCFPVSGTKPTVTPGASCFSDSGTKRTVTPGASCFHDSGTKRTVTPGASCFSVPVTKRSHSWCQLLSNVQSLLVPAVVLTGTKRTVTIFKRP